MPSDNRKVYSFKSVGQTSQETAEQRATTARRPPIGIKTPVQFSTGEGLFEMHTVALDNIKDNFKNLLLTNHGERVGLYDFGANLGPLLFNLGSEDFDAEAIRRISSAVRKYMPFIEPQTFEPFTLGASEQDLSMTGVRITYSIPKLNVLDQKIEVILHAGG